MRIGLIHAKNSLLKMLLSSSGTCLLRGMHGGGGRGNKQSRTSSKKLRRHRAGCGPLIVLGDGAVKSTRSHSTDARRYNMAMSEGLEAQRCSRYSSRVRPNAEISDVAWGKSGRDG